jgi:hypothetical protein
LPKGETETGTWNFLYKGEFGFPGALTSISFPIPLEEGKEDEEGKPAQVVLNVAETEAGTNTTCTGTAAEPTAPEGVLCVYTVQEEFFEVEGPRLIAHLRPAIFRGYGSSGAFISGFGSTKPDSEAKANGTWAVTAP